MFGVLQGSLRDASNAPSWPSCAAVRLAQLSVDDGGDCSPPCLARLKEVLEVEQEEHDAVAAAMMLPWLLLLCMMLVLMLLLSLLRLLPLLLLCAAAGIVRDAVVLANRASAHHTSRDCALLCFPRSPHCRSTDDFKPNGRKGSRNGCLACLSIRQNFDASHAS